MLLIVGAETGIGKAQMETCCTILQHVCSGIASVVTPRTDGVGGLFRQPCYQ